MTEKMINVNINIVMLSFTGLEHNFEKYTTGQVKTLDPMKNFYDFDVSETQDNSEFKHDVYRRRRTVKVTSDFLFFSCNP